MKLTSVLCMILVLLPMAVGAQEAEAPQSPPKQQITDLDQLLEAVRQEQKARRAVSELWYQVTSPATSIRSRGAEVAAAKCPELLRHWAQWQAITGRSGPSTR